MPAGELGSICFAVKDEFSTQKVGKLTFLPALSAA
jgi:hypothetical protein